MKLRNKKTDIIGELHYYPDKAYHFAVETIDPTQTGIYSTLGELLTDWTDFTVRTPLIGDEQIRKVVRAWAELCHISNVKHYLSDSNSCFIFTFEDADYCLDFTIRIGGLECDKIYTITELCGEDWEA